MELAEEDRREQVLQTLPHVEAALEHVETKGERFAEALVEKMMHLESRYTDSNACTEELLRISSEVAEAVTRVCVQNEEQSSKILLEMDLLEHELGRLENVANKVRRLQATTKALEAVVNTT